ncbi:MAG: hypothetical protein FWG75_09225 [Cystobacterineae bacterium]|nr:hypothetical protein [Cystobacterineae bacterium]
MCPDNDDTDPGNTASGAFFRTEENTSSAALLPPPLPKRAGDSYSTLPSLTGAASALTGVDPFQEVPDPSLAPHASPAERLHFLQILARQKSEALVRGRALYVSLEKDYQTLRAKFLHLQQEGAQSPTGAGDLGRMKVLQELIERETHKTQEAEAKVEGLKTQLKEVEEERKDLARALAEVEGQYSQFKQSMEGELESRKQLAEELTNLKEELAQTQDQAAQLAAERADMAGQLEAATEGYESCVREAEQLAEENESLRAEAEACRAEADACRSEIEAYKTSFSQHQSNELHLMASELKGLKERIEASEGEQTWLEQNLERSEARVQELETELQDSKEREASAEHIKEKWMLERRRSLDMVAQLSQEKEAQEAQLKSLKGELSAARMHIGKQAYSTGESASAMDELERLRETVVLLKKRLMVAEAAAEAAAGLKSKIARLEGMLRQGSR